MSSFLKTVTKKNLETIKSHFFKRVVSSFGLKIINTGLGFVRSLMLARWLGVEGLGSYTFAMTWVGLLGMITTLGIPGLLQREIAIYRTQSDWALVKGIRNWAHKFVLFASFLLIPVAIFIAWKIGRQNNSQMILALCVGLLSLPVESLLAIKLSSIQGMHKVVWGQLPNLLITPLLIVVFTGCGYLILADNLDVFIVLALYLISNLISLAVTVAIESKVISKKINSVTPTYDSSVWLKSSLALMFLGCMGMINAHTDVLMLGTLKGARDVGIYVVINRVASLLLFIVMAFKSTIAPSITNLYVKGDMNSLQKLITKSSRSVFLVSSILAIILIIFSDNLLMYFGSDFLQGKIALFVLIAGHFFNTFVGQVNLLLTMTSHAKYTAISIGIGGIINIILNSLLIPKWGVLGAACATATSIVVWNVISLFLVRKTLKIDTTIFGLSIS